MKSRFDPGYLDAGRQDAMRSSNPIDHGYDFRPTPADVDGAKSWALILVAGGLFALGMIAAAVVQVLS